ncbi:hypothetical protein O181_064010 [Austropuccinia psidii MF-1]|uniref:Uncharacterized protein n=1 Tax=Austropuccinia psidii MF-1 TaxID=1389203 RepID=A0A9Q3EJR9_9BASI|nr:hypothetical protein [Austropuccinia psidii MF-1]
MIGNEAHIILNVENLYPPFLIRPSYSDRPRARESLDSHIKELMNLGVLGKLGPNKEVEGTTPVIITWNNFESRMVGDFRYLNTYTIPCRYPIARIYETVKQLSQAKSIISLEAFNVFH